MLRWQSYEYEPFTSENKVLTPDAEVSLKMTDPLPRLDGATAMYPLYSAFVQATYPKKTYYPYDSEVMVNKTPEAYQNLIYGKRSDFCSGSLGITEKYS